MRTRERKRTIAHHEQWRKAEQLSFEFESFEQRLKTTYERLVEQGVKL